MIQNQPAADYLYGTNKYVVADTYVIGTITLTTGGGGAAGTLAAIKRGPYRSTLSAEVATCDITIANGSLMYGGYPLPIAAANGLLDGVAFVAKRVFNGTIEVVRFTGAVEQVEPRSSETRIVAKSQTYTLEQVVGRTVQPNCPYVFKGPDCGATTGTSCAKTPSDCIGHGNYARYGGFPFVQRKPGT